MAGKCKFCEKEIYWQNVTGLWVPFEDKACVIRHDCRKRVEIVKAPTAAVVSPEKPTGPPLERVQVPPLTAEEVFVLRRFVQALKVVQ